jgi:hypothetical protein
MKTSTTKSERIFEKNRTFDIIGSPEYLSQPFRGKGPLDKATVRSASPLNVLKSCIRADDNRSPAENSDSLTLVRRGSATTTALPAPRDPIIRPHSLIRTRDNLNPSSTR